MTNAFAKMRGAAAIGVLMAGGFICVPVYAGAQEVATAAPTVLTVQGTSTAPVTLTAEDLGKMPRTTATLTSEGKSADGKPAEVKTTTYEGVLLYDILVKAGWQFGHGMTGKGMASYVVATGKDGYQVVFSMGEIDPMFGGEKLMLADKANGAALTGREAPFRMVAPGEKMHARSIFGVVKLEVVRLRN